MKRFSNVFIVVVVFICLFALQGKAQKIGDEVVLRATNSKGVPVHSALGDNSYYRWADGSKGKVIEQDLKSGWFKVQAAEATGWVAKTYLVVVTASPEESLEDESLSYTVGAWNLEWFSETKGRGFPENTQGGPNYGPRTDADFQYIADIIQNRITAKVLLLSEINGEEDGHSKEMDRLVAKLDSGWKYYLGKTGRSQRLAVLYDEKVIRKDMVQEIEVPATKVENSDLFDRDPVIGKFTLLDKKGKPANDIVIVGVHLASGQDKVENHNQAMAKLVDRLNQLWKTNTVLLGERDVLVMGDFNASRYDRKIENFWENLDPSGLRLRALDSSEDEYPATRLAGVPLFPRSKIDYIMGSGMDRGIFDELVVPTVQVHSELLPTDFNEFRKHASDHLPVTVRVKVVPDSD